MYKIFVFAAVLAVAAAAPGLVSYSGLPITSYAGIAAPAAVAYGAYGAAPALTYGAYAPAAVAYSAAAIPAPVTYASGYKVAYTAEPVEQHGYKIAY